MALPFEHPFTMIVAGATGTGKTHFVLKLIDNMHTIIKPTPTHIVYYFMEDQPIFGDYPEVEFRHGTPTQSEINELRDTLVIFDDMMMESDIKLLHAFTRGSHHRQNNVVFMVQNFFNTNKHMRTISLNAQYLVFFKSPATTVSSPVWPDRCSETRHVTRSNRIKTPHESHSLICFLIYGASNTKT